MLGEAIKFANYILDNRTTMKETAQHFGTSLTTVNRRLALLQEHDLALYKKVKQAIEEVMMERIRSNARKNNIRFGRS